ncbi:MAG: hypothetical protein GEU28_15285 [Dehalococcoidia bacterium]|nr:hypothetical protein [Dehalococcoidia bacterium]
MRLVLPTFFAVVLLAASCGGDDPDDREQIETVTNEFFEGLLEGDCDKLSNSLAEERQIPEGQCRDFVQGLEDDFAGNVSESLGGTLDEFEVRIDDVRAIDVEGGDSANASVVVHLTFGADGDLSQVFGIDGADGEISGEVNIPTLFAYVRQGGDWKVSDPFQSGPSS